jgi:EmrB/QacA subfamily drug resistance transporter
MAIAVADPPVAAGEAPFRMRTIMAPLVAIIVGVFMVVLDGTAVNVALPRLVVDLHSSLTTLQWTITGYALAQAAVIPLAGWLSDRVGAKRLFLISVVLFTLGSALCATAQTSGYLVFFRILQGLGGGFVLPLAMAYVYRMCPPQKIGAVMGMMGVPILFAPAIGPVLAGWLVQFASWRWIFLINVPIGVIGVAIGIFSLPVLARQAAGTLDRYGVVLAPLAFAALSYGVSEGATSWTSTATIGGIAVGLVALALFIAAELRSSAPLLELRVFQSSEFVRAIVVQWVGQFALFGSLFLVPLFLQQVRGYGAFDTGLILLPQALASALFMPIGGILFDRIGARPLVVVGLGLVAVATFILAHVGVTTQGRDLILPLALSGAGMGLMFMSLNTHLLNAAPRALIGRVTALTNALQQVVNSLSVAGLATILTSRATTDVGAVKAALAAQAGQAPQAAASQVAAGGAAALPPAVQAALSNAFATAFDETFRVMIVAAIVGAALGLLLRRDRARGTDAEGVTEQGELVTGGGFLTG